MCPFINEIHIAGIHIHCGDLPGRGAAGNVRAKGLPIHRPTGCKWQQDGGIAGYFAVGVDRGNHKGID